MRTRTNPLVFILCVALLAGCSRCGKLGAAKAELISLLPKDNATVVIVPDLGVIGDRLKVIQQIKVLNLLAQMQNAGSAEDWMNGVVAQLGIDVRNPEELKKAGLDPSRGAAVVMQGEKAYSVVAISDEGRFDAAVARLAKDRLGASEKGAVKSGPSTITTYGRPNGAPALGYLIRDGYAFIAADRQVPDLATWAAISEEASLLKDQAFNQSLSRLPKERDAIVRLQDMTQTGTAADVPFINGATITIRLTNEALTFTSDSPRPDGAPKYLEKKTVANLLPYLPENAFLVARFQGNPSELDPVWPRLVGSHVERAVRESGFDVNAEVLDNLQPGAVLGLSMAGETSMDLSRVRSSLANFDVRRTNPFALFQLVVVTEVKDAAKAAATLEKLPLVAQKFGATVTPTDLEGRKVYLTKYTAGEGVHATLEGNRLVAAAPQAMLMETVAAMSKGTVGKGPVAGFPSLQSALDAHAVAVTLNIPQLAESIRNLPTHAWGLGGALIRESSLRMIDAVSDLRAVTWSVWSRDDAVQSELSLRYEKK